MKKILVFGGTFNPVHNGHIRLCRLVADTIKADLTLIVPTSSPVHKTVGNELVDSEHRMNMCRLAFDHDNEQVSDIEVSTGKPCYTYETLDKLKKMHPDSQLYLACGSDMFLCLHQWRNPERIFNDAIVCALSRSEEVKVLQDYADRYSEYGLHSIIVDAEPYVISSSEIRAMLFDGKDVSSLIPSSVYEYIKGQGLYQ